MNDNLHLKCVREDEYLENYDHIKENDLIYIPIPCYHEEFLDTFIRIQFLLPNKELKFEDSTNYKYVENFKNRLKHSYDVNIYVYNFIGISGKKWRDWVSVDLTIKKLM